MSDDIQRTVTFNGGGSTRIQDTGGKWQIYAFLACGLGLCLAGIVTITANALFASRYGANGLETGLMMAGSVAVDLLKMTLLLPITAMWRRHTGLAIVGLVLWSCCFAWSTFSAYGMMVTIRSEKAQATAQVLEDRDGVQARIRRQEAQLTALPQYRPLVSIEAAVEAEEQRLGIVSGGADRCARNTQWARDNCGPLRTLREELAAARGAAAIEAGLRADRASLTGLRVNTDSADPQMQGLAILTGLATAALTSAATIFFALLLEAASAAGPTVLMTGIRYARETPEEEPAPAEAQAESVPAQGSLEAGFGRWAPEHIEIEAGAETTSQAAFNAYRQWAPFHGYEPGAKESFGKLLAEYAKSQGIVSKRASHTMKYPGLSLRKAAPIDNLLSAAE